MKPARRARQWRWRSLRGPVVEWLSIVLLVLFIAGPISILGWLVFFTDTFSIQEVTVVDARDNTKQAITDKMKPLLGKNILFIETSSLKQSILTDIPQVRDVLIARKLPSALKITVQEKQPALLLLSNGQYTFIDKNGIAYENAQLDTLPGIVLPTIKNTGKDTEVTLGAPAVSPDFVQFIADAEKSISDITSATVAEYRIPSLSAREVHVLLTNNWLIKFDTTRPLSVQLDVLKRLLQHTISPEDQGKIEYIDLRIPNRVYYKLSGTYEPEPTPTSTR